MTIDEAISYLKEEQMEYPPDEEPELRAALGLGIEALKAHKVAREPPFPPVPYLLPGETED